MVTAVAPAPPALDAGPLLVVEGLEVHFGPVRALDGVDFVVRPGEVVALAGENGAGKSTVVRCIAGDTTPTNGSILVGGRRLGGRPGAAARQGVAVVWQDLALCDNLDVASNLLLGGERRRWLLSDARFHSAAAALLDRLGIPLRDTTRSTRSLSGGQRQLLAVARAMRDQPRLLILDEPTASLGVSESAQVEGLTTELRRQGTTILLVSHDIDQMFRLADRIVVLRHGRVVAEVDPAASHPDEIVAMLSGQEPDSSARRQLSRLHGLVDRLASADPSSSLSLIASALGTALGGPQLSIHLLEGTELRAGAFHGLPGRLQRAWAVLPCGPGGGPAGLAAQRQATVVAADVRADLRKLTEVREPADVGEQGAGTAFAGVCLAAGIRSSWAVPVVGPSGLTGVVTVFRPEPGRPERDELDLVTLYAGYVASAVERDRLLGEVTARNRVLETIREVLETLAGPVPLAEGLAVALGALRDGLQADEVALISQDPGGDLHCRAGADGSGGLAHGKWAGGERSGGEPNLVASAAQALGRGRSDGRVRGLPEGPSGVLAVTFSTPAGPAALVARWSDGSSSSDATSLLEDAANSLRLALEREESERAHQETAALRRSQELQGDFLSRLSHELRTPLTAIRGYASSLMQPDVTWDQASQERFFSRMAAESARLGRLVDDLLDFSAIESGIMGLQPDWCDLPLVIDAAVGCMPPGCAPFVSVSCQAGLPVIWADHDRIEQVLVNLVDNALRHNPPGTHVTVSASVPLSPTHGPPVVVIEVVDDGGGVPEEVATAPFEPRRPRRTPTAGAGLGLSITSAIVDAHGGHIHLDRLSAGTRFHIELPMERSGRAALGAGDDLSDA